LLSIKITSDTKFFLLSMAMVMLLLKWIDAERFWRGKKKHKRSSRGVGGESQFWSREVCDGLHLWTLLRCHWESPCHTTSDGVPRGNSGYINPDINPSCWVLIGP
jgi:hypothetical protein